MLDTTSSMMVSYITWEKYINDYVALIPQQLQL